MWELLAVFCNIMDLDLADMYMTVNQKQAGPPRRGQGVTNVAIIIYIYKSIGKMGWILYPVCGVSDKWQQSLGIAPTWPDPICSNQWLQAMAQSCFDCQHPPVSSGTTSVSLDLGGYRSRQSFHFCLSDVCGGHHWLLQIGLHMPLIITSILLDWQVKIVSSIILSNPQPSPQAWHSPMQTDSLSKLFPKTFTLHSYFPPWLCW